MVLDHNSSLSQQAVNNMLAFCPILVVENNLNELLNKYISVRTDYDLMVGQTFIAMHIRESDGEYYKSLDPDVMSSE